MSYLSGGLAVLLLIVTLVFAFQNWASVDVAFLAWSMSLPKFFLILGTYVFGMLSGWGLLSVVKRAI